MPSIPYALAPAGYAPTPAARNASWSRFAFSGVGGSSPHGKSLPVPLVGSQEAEEKTACGLFIPDTAKEKPQRGTVVAVGPGKVENGTKIDMSVKEGDTVLYGKYSGTEITLGDEEVMIMRESDILGIVNDQAG